MSLTKAVKEKSCKVCKAKFTPHRKIQAWCSPSCAVELAKARVEKAKKAEKQEEARSDRKKREAMKRRSEWLSDAQKAVNAYVRLRDKHAGCISCDRPASWGGQWHASHFRSVGAASAVRFNLWNIHKACSICNNHLSGNIRAYQPRLIEKIGVDRFDWVQEQNQLTRYEIPYLRRLIAVFRKKARRLETRNAM